MNDIVVPPGTSGSSTASGGSTALPTNYISEARELYRKGDLTGALGKYQSMLQEHPGSPDAYAGISRVYMKQKKVDLAAAAVNDGLAVSHDSPRLHVALGEVLFRQGKISEAEVEWVKVIQAGYLDARAYMGLAKVRNALAMYKTEKRMIDKAHELDANDPDVQEGWAGTLSRSARIKYLEAMLAGPNNWDDEERASATRYLDYLRERMKQPKGRCRLVSKVTATETEMVRLLLDPQHLRGFGIAVSLNGHKSNLMLDTGASGITVKRRIADKAGISKLVATKIGGVGDKGRRDAFVGMADSIRIGELEFQNCSIEVMEHGSVADEDGLIGADVFDDFLVDLDFPDEKIKLSELPKRPGEENKELGLEEEEEDGGSGEAGQGSAGTADATNNTPAEVSHRQDRYIAPEMQSFTRVFRFGHDLLVPTKIGDVPAKLFLLDTGAFNNAISPAAAREVTKVHNDDTIVKGISGTVRKVYTANKAVLQFGNIRRREPGHDGV